MLKRCSTCKIEKTTECFHKSKDRKDGLYSVCKECKSAQDKRGAMKRSVGLQTPSVIRDRDVAVKKYKRQSMVVKYGLDIVEVLETLDSDEDNWF